MMVRTLVIAIFIGSVIIARWIRHEVMVSLREGVTSLSYVLVVMSVLSVLYSCIGLYLFTGISVNY